MRGWLVVNEFINSVKFTELFEMLTTAAVQQGIELVKRRGVEAWTELARNNYECLPGVDFVLFWDKDIKLAEAIEQAGVRVFNPSRAIADCDDKARTFLVLKPHKDIRMPMTYISPKKFHNDGIISERFVQDIENDLGFPCVVKECMGSFGQQVYLADNREKLIEIMKNIGDRGYIVQEYIKSSYGRDIRIQIVGDKVVATMYRYNENDFRANVTNGGSMLTYEPNEEQKKTALNVCKYLGLDFGGVDIMFGENDEPIVCEVNSNAHFKNLYDCTGINTANDIIRYIGEQIKC